LLPSDTVLVALVGATIGKVALLKTPSATNQNIAFIKSHEEFSPIFVFYHLMNQYEEFMNIGNGDFKMATQGFIKGLPIILPPLSLQQSFAAKVSAIEAQKQAITQSIQHTEALLAQRMDQYFA
jgi:type I restriction enzyme S subunit